MTTWKQITDYAALAGAKFPECVAAQWALESGFGAHLSGKNNFFGIKGTPGTMALTMEFIDGKWIMIKDIFKDFTGPYDCVKYLVKRWYKDYGDYKGVNRASSRENCARLLVAECYATDPAYAGKLIKLMDDNVKENNFDGKEGFLEKAALYFAGERHQIAAWRELENGLTEVQLKRFKDNFRNTPAGASKPNFPLDVTYFYQLDSTTGHGERSCFSSSMAMALDYVNPEKFEGMDDDDYLRIVLNHGDTVSSTAQIEAAQFLGYNAEFFADGTEADLDSLLLDNKPVPIGVLHKGHISSPSGGGHWICLVGFDETHFWCNDPFGKMDTVNGGYVSNDPEAGKMVKYSRKNLLKRWLIDDSGRDGWGVRIRG